MNRNPQSDKLKNGELPLNNQNNSSKYFEEREIAAEELKNARQEFCKFNENLLLDIRELSQSLEMSIEQSSYFNLAPRWLMRNLTDVEPKLKAFNHNLIWLPVNWLA